jgi:pyrroline-5-carboxylate reductase
MADNQSNTCHSCYDRKNIFRTNRMIDTSNIAIIGAGNMGHSLISGLIKHGYPATNIWASDTNKDKLAQLETKFRIRVTTDNNQATAAAQIILLAIKPQMFSQVLMSLTAIIQTQQPLVLSIAAGIRVASIQKWLGDHIAIIRAMPNTPSLISCGATALYANPFVSQTQKTLAESIMRTVGIVTWLENEKQMDIVTALSGSGPAYFFSIMEALQQGAEELGLASNIARLLTLQTALGAARMAIESGSSLTLLRQQVTSPGGTTEKALAVLAENDICAILKKALQAATQRAEELALLLGETT